MHEGNREFLDDLDELLAEAFDDTDHDVSDLPLGEWWCLQQETIGSDGVVLMTAIPGGAEIEGIGGRNWTALLDAAARLVSRAGRGLGLAEWAAQSLGASVREDMITRIIETLSGELAAAESLPLVDGEVEFEPPY